MWKWSCKNCRRELESRLEPEKCPCGSKEMEKKRRKSRLEKLVDRIKI